MMAQNVLHFNLVIEVKFFNKGRWVSEGWKKEQPEELEEEHSESLKELP